MSTLIRAMAVACIVLGLVMYKNYPDQAFIALPIVFIAPFWWGFATVVDAAELYIKKNRKQSKNEEKQ